MRPELDDAQRRSMGRLKAWEGGVCAVLIAAAVVVVVFSRLAALGLFAVMMAWVLGCTVVEMRIAHGPGWWK